MRKQVELSITHNGKDVVTYPYTKKEHVQFENGMNIDEFVGQDIATPTITHDTTAIKVGVGDSDVSSSVVDSAVNMTIKGQTYQNILPEPTLRNEMQGKSMQRLNEGYDSIETVDGVSKSAILKGQTLVNVDSYYSKDDFVDRHIFNLTDDGWVEMVANGNYRNAFTRFNGMIKPNTKYLAVVEVKENTLVNETLPERPFYLFTNYSNPDGGVVVPFVDQTKWISQGQKGLFKYILTSRGDLSTITVNLRNFVANTTTSGRIIYRTMLIEYVEGMENWDIPFFRGIQSVKMPVLQTIGRNLLPTELSSNFEHKTVNGQQISNIDLTTFLKRGVRYVVKLATSKAFKIATFWSANSNNADEVLVSHGTISANNNNTLAYFTLPINDKSYYMFVNEHGESHSNFISDISQLVAIEMDMGKAPTTIEPYKTNILSTPEEVVLRSLPNGVKDTLNLTTGEYVQRIGETTLDGSSRNDLNYHAVMKEQDGQFCRMIINGCSFYNKSKYGNCDKLTFYHTEKTYVPVEGVFPFSGNDHLYIQISTSRISGADSMEGSSSELKTAFRDWLQANPITIQHELATPIIKTVDLSSHGNWEKLVLDGSENWLLESSFNHKSLIEFKNAVGNGNLVSVISDRFATGGDDVKRIACTRWEIYIRILKSKVNTVDEFKQWLSQNPTTVWYQTTTTQDNSIREMLSFANGHIQVSSEAENSLLPFVQYEIPTKNSYHMDLMKANTQYTMKSKSASGTFTIDGTSYGAGTNGTFTTPTSMTNKLLVMSNKTNKEVMILEGDITSKTIPYFKGIKSAFEDEDRIEILSYGKNLFDMNRPYDAITDSQTTVVQDTNQITVSSADSGMYVSANFILDKDFFAGKTVTGSCLYESDEKDIGTVQISYQDGNGDYHYQWIKTPRTFTFPNNFIGDVMLCVSVNNTDTPQSNTVIVKNIQLELGTKATTYEPSNTTKIPLLHPLRSLPNGVCDELIIDRLNHKAKLIQRVGHVILDGSVRMNVYPTQEKKDTLLVQTLYQVADGVSNLCISDTHPHSSRLWTSDDSEGVMLGGGGEIYRHVDMRLSKAKVSSNDPARIESYLSKNPTTVLYELATPIITEIDLEGYPYAYKDGHIFLNSDIAPTTQITYSINQAQQIESANENLQRHEKEISHLQKLIAQYIQVEYESTLLSLKI